MAAHDNDLSYRLSCTFQSNGCFGHWKLQCYTVVVPEWMLKMHGVEAFREWFTQWQKWESDDLQQSLTFVMAFRFLGGCINKNKCCVSCMAFSTMQQHYKARTYWTFPIYVHWMHWVHWAVSWSQVKRSSMVWSMAGGKSRAHSAPTTAAKHKVTYLH